jgi:hypothetical protein
MDMVHVSECGRQVDRMLLLHGDELKRKLSAARKRRMTADERRAAGLSGVNALGRCTTVRCDSDPEGLENWRAAIALKLAEPLPEAVRRMATTSDHSGRLAGHIPTGYQSSPESSVSWDRSSCQDLSLDEGRDWLKLDFELMLESGTDADDVEGVETRSPLS